jgi:hypothetical protein
VRKATNIAFAGTDDYGSIAQSHDVTFTDQLIADALSNTRANDGELSRNPPLLRQPILGMAFAEDCRLGGLVRHQRAGKKVIAAF